MKHFGGPSKGNWWEKKPRNPRVSWFLFLRKNITSRPPLWKRVARPVVVIITALTFALAGIMPTIKEHVRVARAATITVCSSSCDYTTIIAAVNASSEGDTISIGTGTFSVTTTLNLASKAKIFDGNGASNTTIVASTSATYIFSNTTDAGLATTYTIKEMTINEQSGTAPGILTFNSQTSPITLNFTDNTVTSFGNTARGVVAVSSGNTSGITATVSGNTITMDGSTDIVIDWDGVGTTSTITVANNTFTNGAAPFDYSNGAGVGSTITFNNNTASGYGTAMATLSGGTTINVYSNTVTGANTNEGIVIYPDTGGTTNIYSNNLTMGDGTSNNGIDVLLGSTQVTSTQMNIYRNIITGSDRGIDISGNGTSAGVINVYNNVLYDLNSVGIIGGGENMFENIFNNTIDNSPAGINSTADSGTTLNIINNSLTDTGKSGAYTLACATGNEKIYNNNVYTYTNLNNSCGTYSIGTQGNINVVPGYTNHNTNDFSLSATSTCSAAADNCDSGMASTTVFQAHVSSGGANTLVSATDLAQIDQFNGLSLGITAGTGSGQTATITDVVSSTDTITVGSNWSTQPDSTSVFRVFLSITNDYSGNTRPDAGTSIIDIGAYEFIANTAPGPPSTLYTSSTSAQSGSSNPSNVSTTAPIFSAIANDYDSSENLVSARIQVASTTGFSSGNLMWDSQKTSITTTTKGSRISNITFNSFGATATTTLSLNDGDRTYYWRLKLWDDSDAEGAWSSASTTDSFTLVDVPTTTSAVAGTYVSDSSITVTWTDGSSTETGFVVQRSTNEGSYSTVSTTDLGISSYSDTGTSANAQYVYRVAAQNAAGTSFYTTSTAVATTPSAATSATTTYNSDSSITVGWTDNSSYESGFVVQSSVNDGSYSTASTTATSTVSYANTGTSADNKYIYRMFARNSFATSTAVTSTAVYTSSDAPTIGSPTVNSTSSISWAWTDNSNYEETFRLDFSTGSGTDVDDIASTSASYTTTGLSINTQYAVHIHAYRSDRGESTASATSSAVYTLAAIPVSGAATGDNTSAITVSWGTNSNPSGTGYYVENVTASTNSGWITTTSTQFTVLSAGTTYTFRVKARNGDSTETSFTDSFTGATNSQGGSSGGGDGGGGSGAPSVSAGPDATELPKDKEKLEKDELGSFYINDGAKWTNKTDVTLGFDVSKVTHLAVADNSAMKGGSVVPYVASMKWKLVGDDGPKTLYAQFYDLNRGTKSTVVKASILLDATPPGAPKIVNAPPYEDISDWLKSGGQLKGTADAEVRIVLLLQRTDLTDKIRKKVLELRALRRKQQGLREEQQTAKKKAEEAEKRAEATEKEVNDLLKRVKDLQEKLDSLQGEEEAAQAERDRLRAEEQEVLNRIRALEQEQKALEKEEKKGPTKIQVSDRGNLKTADDFWGEVRIAAATKTTHKTESDTNGDWAYAFTAGTFTTQGEYSITANAEDGGGNKSGTTQTSFAALEGDAPKAAEPPPEEKKVVTTTPEKTTKKTPEPKEEEPKETIVKKPAQPITKPVAPSEEPSAPTGVVSGETGAAPSGGESGTAGGGETTGATSGGAPAQEQPETVAQATKTVTEVAQVVAETATVVAKETVKEVTMGVVQTYQLAKVVADNPVVERVNETVAAPTVAAAAVANVATGTATLPSMLLYLRFLFLQPAMLFGRKKKRAWGVVYNGFTKVPVDLALVRLVMKEKGQVLQSRVTDVAGRYYFLAKQGEYVLEVAKPGFGPVSKHLAKVEEDGEFKPVYHGDSIAVTADATPVQPCIPLDPDAKKEDVKTTVKKNVWKRVQQSVSGVGFGFSMVSFAVSPSWWVGALLGVHATSYLFFRRLSKRERGAQFGTIKDKSTGKAIAQTVVRIFDVEYNKLLDTRVTDKDGRYVFLVGKNKYYLMIEAPGFAQYLSQPIEMKEMGAIVANISLVPRFKSAEAPTPELAAALAAGEHKEKEAEVRDPSKTRISSDGIPQPSIGFLKSMGVAAETLAKGMLGAEVPLVAAGAGSAQQINVVTPPSTPLVSDGSPKFASSESQTHTGDVVGEAFPRPS